MHPTYFRMLRILKRRGMLKGIDLKSRTFTVLYIGDFRLFREKNLWDLYSNDDKTYRGSGFYYRLKFPGCDEMCEVVCWTEHMLWLDKALKKATHKKQRVFLNWLAGGCK